MAKDYNEEDVAFIRMMIKHHLDAVRSSDEYLDKGKNGDVKKWAAAIVSGQRQEVARFRSWLKERGLKESGSGEM